MQISTQRSDYISGKYLPQGAKLWGPSKLQKKEVISLLEFWRDRQRLDPANVFTFRKWRDATGSLQDPVEIDSDEEGASQRRTAAKGKRKAAPDHWPTDTEESKDDQARWDSSALPKSRQVGSKGSGVNSDMAGGSTHRTEDRLASKGKRQVAGAKPGPSKMSGTKGQNARRVPQESQERSDNGSDKQQRRPKRTQRAPTRFPEESPQVALVDKRKRK
ncbi:hypothetical protein PAXRUDRAFT_22664 [Paxillus rubicundulus Ve08.2h10]|uniref:Uncharacterized protein n=1 Tax=Paxillus rubicundulus Ve08.2h10 TaxID=930991 RepID=A0A0D0D4Z8_9AGAM|nr:hypothetical protein PAXRUDRAFT_22664 [Paxillus rubicundulus Ve08.2h10]